MPTSTYANLIGTTMTFYSVKDRKRVKATVQSISRHPLRNGRFSYMAKGLDQNNRSVTKIIANDPN